MLRRAALAGCAVLGLACAPSAWQAGRLYESGTRALDRGEVRRAIDELEAAGVHGSRKLEARALELRGRCLVAMDRRDEATEALDRALEIARRLGNPPVQWRALALLAELARRAGDGAGSERHANAARQLAEAHSRTLTDAGLRRSLHALADGLVVDPLGRRR